MEKMSTLTNERAQCVKRMAELEKEEPKHRMDKSLATMLIKSARLHHLKAKQLRQEIEKTPR